jgi:hypothetical protein
LQTYEQQQQSQVVSFNGGFNPAAAGGSSQHQFEAQQSVVAVREQQEILQTYEQQQQQEKPVSFNCGFDSAAAANSVTASGFDQTNIAGGGGGVMPPSLEPGTFENPYQIRTQQRLHHDHDLQTQLQQLHKQDQTKTNIAGGGGVMSPSLEPGTLEYPSQLQPQQWEPNEYNLPTQLQKLDQHNQRPQLLIDEKRKGKRVAEH